MRIALGFDGVIVEQEGRLYHDTQTPLVFVPGAEEGLRALKAAGHLLIVSSSRANLALREDPLLDPLVRDGVVLLNRAAWEKAQPVYVARYEQMVTFVRTRLAGVIDAIDDGRQGKVSADLYLDSQAVRLARGGVGAQPWSAIAALWGARVYPPR